MTSSVVSNTCRLTVLTSRVRVDLAVPVALPVAELVATIVARLGPEFADESAAQGGLILQRAGGAPLDPAATLAVSGVRDGDVLNLRPRSEQLPALAFDDVLDAVGEGVLTRTVRWQPSHTRAMSVVAAGVALGFAIVALLMAGAPWIASTVAAGVIGALLLAASAPLARSYGLRGSAIAASSFAIAFAFEAGGLGMLRHHHGLSTFGTAQLLVGACAAVLAAVIAILAVNSAVPGFIAVIGAGVLTAIGAAIAQETSLTADSTAALIAAVALASSPILPMLSIRLARLPLPALPTSARDLRADTSSIDSERILAQAVAADQYLSGLVSTVAVTVGGAGVVLSPGRGTAPWLAAALAVICLLRARLFTRRAQRAPLLATTLAIALALLLARVARFDHQAAVVAAGAGGAFAGLVLLAVAALAPGHRYSPPWGRWADVLEALLVLAVIPLALGVMGVYGAVKRLGS